MENPFRGGPVAMIDRAFLGPQIRESFFESGKAAGTEQAIHDSVQTLYRESRLAWNLTLRGGLSYGTKLIRGGLYGWRELSELRSKDAVYWRERLNKRILFLLGWSTSLTVLGVGVQVIIRLF